MYCVYYTSTIAVLCIGRPVSIILPPQESQGEESGSHDSHSAPPTPPSACSSLLRGRQEGGESLEGWGVTGGGGSVWESGGGVCVSAVCVLGVRLSSHSKTRVIQFPSLLLGCSPGRADVAQLCRPHVFIYKY